MLTWADVGTYRHTKLEVIADRLRTSIPAVSMRIKRSAPVHLDHLPLVLESIILPPSRQQELAAFFGQMQALLQSPSQLSPT